MCMLKNYTKLASAEEIDQMIDGLARKIIADYPETSPLFVVLLRGAAPFASKLAFALARIEPKYHPDLDYMLVSTYGEDHHAKEPVIVADLAPDTQVAGRTVIVLDDVIDLGVTSDFVKEILVERGAQEVKLAVFASKAVPSRQSQADYCCMAVGDKWLVGFGLDDATVAHEGYRWLDELYEIKKKISLENQS